MSLRRKNDKEPSMREGAPSGNRVKASSEKVGRWSASRGFNPDRRSDEHIQQESELKTSKSYSQALTSNSRDINAWLNEPELQGELPRTDSRSNSQRSEYKPPPSPTGAYPKQSLLNHKQHSTSGYSSSESNAQGTSSNKYSADKFKGLRSDLQSPSPHEAQPHQSSAPKDQARAKDDESKEKEDEKEREDEMEWEADDAGVNYKEVPKELEKGSTYCKGTPLIKLKRAPECYSSRDHPVLRPSRDHQVFFFIPPNGRLDKLPVPYPGKNVDEFWRDGFVEMPYARDNRRKWEVITSFYGLRKSIGRIKDLKDAIYSYNYACYGLETLEYYFQTDRAAQEKFFTKTLPKMQRLALDLPDLCGKPIPILKKFGNIKLTFTQQQIACLLANAFFCTFPGRDEKKKGQTLPHFNFTNLLHSPGSDSAIPRKVQKIKCLLNYFDRVTTEMPTGTVSYARHNVRHSDQPDWKNCDMEFTELHISASGTIEDDGEGMLQVDFANKYVGGGVIGGGLVQEEIRFVLCPEMILSRLFTEVLHDNEVLIMTGCERFNNYKGYADSFEYTGSYEDTSRRDPWGRRNTEVVAMDALVVRHYNFQFEKKQVFRELNKAYCAFKGYEFTKNLPAVRTSNWGCGAFGGNKQLKALIQMMAASAAGRDVCYFTFGDKEFCDELAAMNNIIKKHNLKIHAVMDLICEYEKKFLRHSSTAKSTPSLFQFIAMMCETSLTKAGSDDYFDPDY